LIHLGIDGFSPNHCVNHANQSINHSIHKLQTSFIMPNGST